MLREESQNPLRISSQSRLKSTPLIHETQSREESQSTSCPHGQHVTQSTMRNPIPAGSCRRSRTRCARRLGKTPPTTPHQCAPRASPCTLPWRSPIPAGSCRRSPTRCACRLGKTPPTSPGVRHVAAAAAGRRPGQSFGPGAHSAGNGVTSWS